MENFKNLARTKFPENKADVGGSKDQKMSIHKTQSLKEKKKGENWLQRQLLMRKKSGDYDSKDLEHAAAIAATAYAISSQDISEIPLNKTKTKEKGSFKMITEWNKKETTSSSIIDDEKKPEKLISPLPSNQTLNKPNTMGGETEAQTWQKAQLEKIKQKYEKLNESISSWENKKKLKAKRKLNMQESELERTRVKAMDKFRKEMENINEEGLQDHALVSDI
ncbi:remorin-like isoform X2 [Senna tora]|uniref:Remorin-like isoform X2 n=1 Tax=Senna tora TaxID=362788 RepID=A0A834TT42_9FABA|nr:remorin-like isoform X2 [Senna tora]